MTDKQEVNNYIRKIKQTRNSNQNIHHNQKYQSLHKSENEIPLNSLVSKIQTTAYFIIHAKLNIVMCYGINISF